MFKKFKFFRRLSEENVNPDDDKGNTLPSKPPSPRSTLSSNVVNNFTEDVYTFGKNSNKHRNVNSSSNAFAFNTTANYPSYENLIYTQSPNHKTSSNDTNDTNENNCIKQRHMIVDDNSINRDIIRRAINIHARDAKGVDVIIKEAENGKIAYDIFNDGYIPDVFWVDINMTEMNGIELTKKLRASGYQSKIYGVTGLVDDITKAKCKRAKMNEVLSKPVEREVIISYCRQL